MRAPVARVESSSKTESCRAAYRVAWWAEGARIRSPAHGLGRRAVPRADGVHVRRVLRRARRGHPGGVVPPRQRAAAARPGEAPGLDRRAVRGLREDGGDARLARPLLLQPPARQRPRLQVGPGHGRARARRDAVLDGDRDPDRDPLRAAAALAARPGRDDLRPDRDLLPPDLDRLDPPLRVLVPARLAPARRLLRHVPDHRRLLRPARVGDAPDPAVDRLRAPLRRALHADDPLVHDRGAPRGPRDDRPREGRLGVPRDPPPRPAPGRAPDRDDARDGPRDLPRERRLRRDGVRAAGDRHAARQRDDPARPAGARRDHRLRDGDRARVQPRRRPRVRAARSAGAGVPAPSYASQSAQARS